MKKKTIMIVTLMLLAIGIVTVGCGKNTKQKSDHKTTGVRVIYLPRVGGTGITPHYIIH